MAKISIKKELNNFAQKHSYFSQKGAIAHLKKSSLEFSKITVNQYLSQLKKEAQIFDAGLYWYSKLKIPFQLDKQKSENFVNDLKKSFPFLEFNYWSIGQLKNYFHHLFTREITFVYSDSDALGSLSDFLTQQNYNVYNNPGKAIVNNYFKIKEKTVVLRPSISEEPVDKYYSTIEKILVDLLLESERLNLFDRSEYKRIFFNVICSGRINIAKMLRYSNRREIKKIFLNEIINSEDYINCYNL